jgi:hypothetical protein
MIQFENLKGEFRTVMGHDLGNLTMQGWNLVFSYQETQQMSCSETELLPVGTQNNYGQTVNVQRYKPVTHTWFVVHKDEESVLAEAHAREALAQGALAKEQEARKADVKKLTEVEARLTKAVLSAKQEEDQRKRVAEDRDRFRGTAVKLEGDLAKVKAAIGELKYHEIIPKT